MFTNSVCRAVNYEYLQGDTSYEVFQSIPYTLKGILPDERHDRTFGINVREVLPDEKHHRTFGIKVREVLPNEKHDQTFGIKVREVLPDERHDQTFGIKCCQMKSTTGLLELSITE
ncbi:hypothetical protein RclHR1_00060024 [Rhizophagus clarus]|uniref:Uncharacterized protein n=1 Tax=Rhizophagus clarus TaxID=94130 RepID=A0A2Z6RRY0_9GLOM|nr:hypothetical protein RclHR1_00060024 [Rhizophagus clarus]